MSKVMISIWGKSFEMSVCKEYYPGEFETEEQAEALDLLLSAKSEIDNSKEKVAEYLLKKNADELTGEKMDNLFRYVMPKSIYIPRKNKTAVILCNYKFDPEHGLALVFEKGKFKKICSQDAI